MESYIKLIALFFLGGLFVFQGAWGAQIWKLQIKNELNPGSIVKFVLKKPAETNSCLEGKLSRGEKEKLFDVYPAQEECYPLPMNLEVTSQQTKKCPPYNGTWKIYTISGTPSNIKCTDTTPPPPPQ